MADTPKPGQELKVLLQGSDGRVCIRSKDGKDYHLPPLDMYDMLEMERRMGTAFADDTRLLKLADVVFVVYLSLRKDGISVDDLGAGKYKLTERDVARMLDLRYLNKYAELFADMMKMSGVVFPEPSPDKGKPESLAAQA